MTSPSTRPDCAAVIPPLPDAVRASDTITKVAIAGGSVVPIASGLSGPVSLAVDAQYVYWVNSADGSVMKTPK